MTRSAAPDRRRAFKVPGKPLPTCADDKRAVEDS